MSPLISSSTATDLISWECSVNSFCFLSSFATSSIFFIKFSCALFFAGAIAVSTPLAILFSNSFTTFKSSKSPSPRCSKNFSCAAGESVAIRSSVFERDCSFTFEMTARSSLEIGRDSNALIISRCRTSLPPDSLTKSSNTAFFAVSKCSSSFWRRFSVFSCASLIASFASSGTFSPTSFNISRFLNCLNSEPFWASSASTMVSGALSGLTKVNIFPKVSAVFSFTSSIFSKVSGGRSFAILSRDLLYFAVKSTSFLPSSSAFSSEIWPAALSIRIFTLSSSS